MYRDGWLLIRQWADWGFEFGKLIEILKEFRSSPDVSGRVAVNPPVGGLGVRVRRVD